MYYITRQTLGCLKAFIIQLWKNNCENILYLQKNLNVTTLASCDIGEKILDTLTLILGGFLGVRFEGVRFSFFLGVLSETCWNYARNFKFGT